jgi:hypothetical protein
MRLTAIGGSVLMVLIGAASSPVSAQEAFTFDASTVAHSLVVQPATTAVLFAQTRRGTAPRTTLGAGPRTLGVGLRTGGFGFGVGASLRSWFESSSWGFQVGVSHYGYVGHSSTQFTPALLYEFELIQTDAPLSLRPFVGGGLSVIQSSYPGFVNLNFADRTDTNVLLLGGVEMFFPQVPKLGVSGELEFTPSNNPYVGVDGLGGPGFVALAHWYFK